MLIDKKNKYAIGFDLGIEFSQISYCNINQSMPETFSLVNGQEKYNIPTMLCFKDDNWYADGVELATFIRKSLLLLSSVCRIDDIAAIAFNLKSADTTLMSALEEAVLKLNIKHCDIYFMTCNDSFFEYLIHQPEEMWVHDVLLYDYQNDGIKSYRLSVNRKTRPQVCYIEEDFHEEMKYEGESQSNSIQKDAYNIKIDDLFLEIAQRHCEGRVVSSVFLLGDNFTTQWCKLSLKYLCRGRRVFQGNNLFSKGACYFAREKLLPSTLSTEYVFLSEDKLKANIGMYCIEGREEVYIPLLNAGTHWYEAKYEQDLILDKENKITLSLKPVDGSQPKKVEMTLDGLQVRGNRTNRIGFRIEMKNEHTVELMIVDKGFGEFYAATGQVWRESFEL